ncbi:MAG: transcription elongation factor GreA [Parcubacteria group bacterium]|nr:transcription elongation factor GreA [Parcubacteria group bacterium]|tara:strand:- start:4691 stop:5149 length:459 start_codon:yes stop_codon:yes gene_type:complete
MGVNYITKDGLKKLKEEMEDLKKNKMPEVIERIARAKELGDLSENAEYQDAKDEQGFIAGRITELENLTSRSEIIDNKGNKDFVTVGCTIRALCGDKEFKYTIVGSNEADPTQGLISNESPIGRAFLGHQKGEKVVVQVPNGDMDCEILEIT